MGIWGLSLGCLLATQAVHLFGGCEQESGNARAGVALKVVYFSVLKEAGVSGSSERFCDVAEVTEKAFGQTKTRS